MSGNFMAMKNSVARYAIDGTLGGCCSRCCNSYDMAYDAERNRHSRNSRIMRRQAVYSHIVVFLGVFTAAVLLSLCIGAFTSSAREGSDRDKYYTQIEIESGDTLWDIASNNMTDEYSSVGEYVNDIITVNQLGSMNIHAGEYLILPYYK